MADPRVFDDAPTGIAGREVIALILALLGATGLIVGIGLYDWRAGLATAGAVLLVIGVLLGMG